MTDDEQLAVDVPDDLQDAVDRLAESGVSPNNIDATVEWITTDKTQSEVADEYGTSQTEISRLKQTVFMISPTNPDEYRSLSQSKMIRAIADCLGWEEGVQYDTGPGGIYVLKDGWVSIYDELVADGGETDD